MRRRRTAALLRSQFIPCVLDRLRERGLAREADALAEELGIRLTADDEAAETTVPADVHHAFCQRAEGLLGDAHFGLHIAASTPRGFYGLMEFALRSASTLGEALARLEKYTPLLSETLTISAEAKKDRVEIRHRMAASSSVASSRHANEFGLAILLRLGRDATGVRIVPSEVRFSHAAPADLTELHAFFGTTRIVFDRDGNGLSIDGRVLDLPLRAADAALLRVLTKEIEDALPSSRTALGPIPGLRARIRKDLGDGTRPTLERAAEALRCAPRTLQRRLNDAGTSFQSELDGVRSDLAIELLEETDMSIYEIALELGYHDQSAFERAFRRWHRRTPSRYRDGS